MDKHFGEHVMIDGYGGNLEKLNDKERVTRCLRELPESLGMHLLNEPTVLFAPGNDLKDPGGWSGFVVIMESHISIHTFPLRGFVSIDVYTCQNGLDSQQLCEYFKNEFELKDVEVNFVKRGHKYPDQNIY
jgi:S-adenosylmethionine decarboxylase